MTIDKANISRTTPELPDTVTVVTGAGQGARQGTGKQSRPIPGHSGADRGAAVGAGETARPRMGLGSLIAFFALTFGLTWGLAILFIPFADQMLALFGPMSGTNPLFILAVYSPGLAGLFLVWRHYGVRGLLNYFRRLTLRRMPVAWWGLLVIGIPTLVFLAAALKGTLRDPFPFSPWYLVLPALAVTLFIGPIEELGWRGVALPLLQRRVTPLWASLILGVIWAVWHVPAFLLSGTPQSAWSFAPYFIGVVALSVIVTPMFNAARGSLLIAVLFHFQINSPLWPDAQPWDSLVFVIVAVGIVVLNRRTLLTRKGAVTDVLMPGEEASLRNAGTTRIRAGAGSAV
jgi:membrane protease YdiL (CAAX protease family)